MRWVTFVSFLDCFTIVAAAWFIFGARAAWRRELYMFGHVGGRTSQRTIRGRWAVVDGVAWVAVGLGVLYRFARVTGHSVGALAAGCPVRPGQRLTADSMLGLPMRVAVAELRRLCPSARLDTIGVGGSTAAALRFDAAGVTLWAIQPDHDPFGDSLHYAEQPGLWAARGDSLRFPDGQLVPLRVGALRAIDSSGVVVIDHGDDGTGSYVVRCRYPFIALIVDNVWLYHERGSTVPFARVSPSDTTSFWRVEMLSGKSDSAVTSACSHA